MANFDKIFNIIQNRVSKAHVLFYVWKELQNKQYEKGYKKNKYFWGAIILALQESWFSTIIKLFEKREDVISIYSLLEFIKEPIKRSEIENKVSIHKKTLINIRKWRNKVSFHEDKKVLLDPRELFFHKHQVKYDEIEEMLSLLEELLGDIYSATSGKRHIFSYKTFRDSSQQDVNRILSELKIKW